jgi:hypothetical protein
MKRALVTGGSGSHVVGWPPAHDVWVAARPERANRNPSDLA